MQSLFGTIEGGGSKFLCAVGTGPHDIHAELRVPTLDPDRVVTEIAAFFEPYRARLAGLGVCSFGPLELGSHEHPDYGSLLRTPKPGWSYFPLRSRLAKALAVPVFIDTDVNGAALAEQRWGAGKAIDPLVYVTVGTGIGVGVVIDGRALHGLMHPELGHGRTPRARGDEFSGACPFHGDCFEGMASATALLARTGKPPSELHDDDPIWEFQAHYLAMLVHTIVLAYSPKRVVMGGGVAERQSLWPKLRAALHTSLAGYVPRPELSETGLREFLVPSTLSGRAGLYGGFALAQAGVAALRT